MRIAEADDTLAGQHDDHGVGALDALVGFADGLENLFRRQLQAAADLQLVREYVEQYLRVRLGVDMAQVGTVELGLDLLHVGQVAVVREADAVGGVDVKGLRLGR